MYLTQASKEGCSLRYWEAGSLFSFHCNSELTLIKVEIETTICRVAFLYSVSQELHGVLADRWRGIPGPKAVRYCSSEVPHHSGDTVTVCSVCNVN